MQLRKALLRGCLGTLCRQRWSGALEKTGHRSGKTNGSHLFLAHPLHSPLDTGPRTASPSFPTKVCRAGNKARSLQRCSATPPPPQSVGVGHGGPECL